VNVSIWRTVNEGDLLMRKVRLLGVLLLLLLSLTSSLGAERIRYAYPAKSLNFLPIFLGNEKGIFAAEGIDLEPILVASPIQVAALTTGDLEFSGARVRSWPAPRADFR
jgi:ABC-type nitrate/sulfonate/bicarbonate transport system substrate-binding protein